MLGANSQVMLQQVAHTRPPLQRNVAGTLMADVASHAERDREERHKGDCGTRFKFGLFVPFDGTKRFFLYGGGG